MTPAATPLVELLQNVVHDWTCVLQFNKITNGRYWHGNLKGPQKLCVVSKKNKEKVCVLSRSKLADGPKFDWTTHVNKWSNGWSVSMFKTGRTCNNLRACFFSGLPNLFQQPWSRLHVKLTWFCWGLPAARHFLLNGHGADFIDSGGLLQPQKLPGRSRWSRRKVRRKGWSVGKPREGRNFRKYDDGRKPANQLRLVVYPMIYRDLYIQVVQDFSHQYELGCPPSQTVTNEGFYGSPPENIIILGAVTVTGQGDNPTYECVSIFVAPTNPSVSPAKDESICVEVNFVDWGEGS